MFLSAYLFAQLVAQADSEVTLYALSCMSIIISHAQFAQSSWIRAV